MIRCVAPGISLFAFDSARGFIGTFVKFAPPVSRPAIIADGLIPGYCRIRAMNENRPVADKITAQDIGSRSWPMVYALAVLAEGAGHGFPS